MELIKNAEFIRGLGEKEFKARLPQLPKIPCNVKLPKGKYAIIFTDADAPIQMWNYKNFSIVIQNMLNESIDAVSYTHLLTGLYGVIWINWYNKIIWAPFFRRGNWMMIFIYGLLLLFFMQLYGGFKIALLKRDVYKRQELMSGRWKQRAYAPRKGN